MGRLLAIIVSWMASPGKPVVDQDTTDEKLDGPPIRYAPDGHQTTWERIQERLRKRGDKKSQLPPLTER